MMNKRFVINMVSSLLLGAALVSAPLQAVEGVMMDISKVDGMPWFNRMNEGVVEAGKVFGVSASQVRPSNTDTPQQVKIIEDLITRKVNTIIIVSNDANVLGPVFKKARDAGVVVLTNESLDQSSTDWDIEIIGNEKFAAEYVEHMTKRMGGEDGYVIYAGSLTVLQHNLWADLLVKHQKEHHPDMHEVTRRIPVAESVNDSCRTTLDLVKTYPDLKAVISLGPNGPIGAGCAVKEKRVENKVVVYGMVAPLQTVSLIKSDDITEGITYNPAFTGYAFVAVTSALLKGEEIKPGLEI